MGPFQTIDLNAPNGVLDYCERYYPGIQKVVKSQDNERTWRPDTIRAINEYASLHIIPNPYSWYQSPLLRG